MTTSVMNTSGISHSHTVPIVAVDEPKIGLPSPPSADHQPHRNTGTSSSGMATSSTPESTNGTGQMWRQRMRSQITLLSVRPRLERESVAAWTSRRPTTASTTTLSTFDNRSDTRSVYGRIDGGGSRTATPGTSSLSTCPACSERQSWGSADRSGAGEGPVTSAVAMVAASIAVRMSAAEPPGGQLQWPGRGSAR